MATMEISVVPIGTATTSVGDYVAACEQVLASIAGIKFELNPMGTCLEGELPILLDALRQVHESVFSSGAKRVYTVVKIDDRRDKESTLASKMASVKGRLGR